MHLHLQLKTSIYLSLEGKGILRRDGCILYSIVPHGHCEITVRSDWIVSCKLLLSEKRAAERGACAQQLPETLNYQTIIQTFQHLQNSFCNSPCDTKKVQKYLVPNQCENNLRLEGFTVLCIYVSRFPTYKT